MRAAPGSSSAARTSSASGRRPTCGSVPQPTRTDVLDFELNGGKLDLSDALHDHAFWQIDSEVRPNTAYIGVTDLHAGSIAFVNPGLSLFLRRGGTLGGRFGAAVVAHEPGHVLGAGHDRSSSLMAPTINRSRFDDPDYLPEISPYVFAATQGSPLLGATEAVAVAPVPLPAAAPALAGALAVLAWASGAAADRRPRTATPAASSPPPHQRHCRGTRDRSGSPSMPHLSHALTMLAAGIGIPVLAALNARLGARLGSPALAASVLFVVAFACAAAATLATGTEALSRTLAQPRHLYVAGVLVAFYVLSITWIAPTFGVGNAVFCVLLGQLVSAAAIDHFGLMGARPAPISATRAAGIALMAAGVLLTQKA